jgi:hypothetical protein
MRVEYLLDTVTDFQKQDELLWDIVEAMSDREFDDIYQFICRMRDIEPDEEKFNEQMTTEL